MQILIYSMPLVWAIDYVCYMYRLIVSKFK